MGEDQKRALLAVVLSGIVLFGWQYFFVPKQIVNTPKAVETKVVDSGSTMLESTTNANSQKSGSIEPVNNAPIGAENFTLKNEKVSYTLDNYLVLQDATNTNASFNYETLFQSKDKSLSIEFKTTDKFETKAFVVNQISDSEVKLTNSEENLVVSLLLQDNGLLSFNINSSNNFNYRFAWHEKAQKLENGQIKQFVLYSDDLTTTQVGDEETGDLKLKWGGIDFNYHLLSIVFPKESNHLFKTTETGEMTISKASAVNELSFDLIFTKKEYDTLLNLGNKLHLSVDFGIWSLIAVPILRGLQFFHDLFPNWGISIILLTLIIRTLTFPLQYKSFKSMKKMQVIQPELNKIREKYKEDPQRMQAETMALFKQAGANPLGGCLPLLLQMPIFFAFYKVLYSSVELVQAPFFLWIKDLSEKDPYYVLPVLMAAAMFLHQKVTPTTTADPVQKKVMMFMPILFGLFMKDLPAGLTLYIFVSTIMGLLQQLFVYKRT